jgi:NADPH-dependent curcumin reductase CurA
MTTTPSFAPTQIRLRAYPAGPVIDDTWLVSHDPLPALQPGEIRVRIKHLSVDPGMRGWITPKRSYIAPVQPGEAMRAFGVGEVLETASKYFQVGDHVTGFTGVQTEAVLDGRQMRKVDLSFAPARSYLTSVGMTAFTAYFGLLDVGKPKAGQTVVVSAAAGAVGAVVCQIAKIQGCKVIGIAGGPEKCSYLRDELGVDAAIDYKGESVAEALKLAAPDGVDIFFDNVGGDILDAVLMQINRHARIVVCGAISQYTDIERARGPANYLQIIAQSANMQGFTMRDYLARIPEAFMSLMTWQSTGKLKVREHVLHGIDSFPKAFQMLFTGENLGKLVIDL